MLTSFDKNVKSRRYEGIEDVRISLRGEGDLVSVLPLCKMRKNVTSIEIGEFESQTSDFEKKAQNTSAMPQTIGIF